MRRQVATLIRDAAHIALGLPEPASPLHVLLLQARVGKARVVCGQTHTQHVRSLHGRWQLQQS
jgi:hypothetical protein